MMSPRLIIASLFVALASSSAFAGLQEGQSWFASLQDDTKFLVQTDLVLIGLYDRYIDGDYGAGTYRAIAAYQSRAGHTPSGILTDGEMQSLNDEAAEIYGRLGFAAVKDLNAKIALFVPLKLLDSKSSSAKGTVYASEDDGIVLETLARPFSEESFERLFGKLGSSGAGRIVTYSSFNAAAFTISGEQRGRKYFSKFYNDGNASVGFTLTWTDRYAKVGKMVSIMVANLSAPANLENAPPQSSVELPDNGPAPQYASGSGFIFSPQGLIATNFHVAGRCTSLAVPGYGEATLVRGDEKLDLAVIQLDSKTATHWATIRSTPPVLAENVVLLGYPLADILNSSLNVATGIVSAETGLAGNKDWFTTNAGIQPGNSGGPILDLEGHVVGVAVAKIDDAKLLAALGDTAPNVGFGINNATLLQFLEIFQHSETRDDATAPLAVQDVAKVARQFTVQIICQEAP
jgi:S1-C subfamily serine protease